MMTAQRREEIKRYMLEYKTATAAGMAEKFNVSGQTIRRDFEAMEKEGFLLRSYGGAVVKDRKAVDIPNVVKSELLVDAKRIICSQAVRFVSPNDCIFLDHSTTVLSLCDEIAQIPLTVVTNSHRVIGRLSGCPNIQLISTGGIFNNSLEGFFGLETVKYLQQHCVDKAFLSCRAIDLTRGLNDSDEKIADVRRNVIENSDLVYLLADHTKFGKTGFIATCDVEKIDYVITDEPVDEAWRKLFEKKKVNLFDGK